MCAMGRALMAKPKLLMLDEPSLGLAPILVETIFQIVREINAQGTPVLLVDQDRAQLPRTERQRERQADLEVRPRPAEEPQARDPQDSGVEVHREADLIERPAPQRPAELRQRRVQGRRLPGAKDAARPGGRLHPQDIGGLTEPVHDEGDAAGQ